MLKALQFLLRGKKTDDLCNQDKAIATDPRLSMLPPYEGNYIYNREGKKTLHSSRLAFSCSTISLISLALASSVFFQENVNITIRVIWFCLTFLILLFPTRLLVNNVFCLFYSTNRNLMFGREITSKTYRNTLSNQRMRNDDSATFIIPVFTESFEIIKQTIQSAIHEAKRTSPNVNVLVSDDSLAHYTNNIPLLDYYTAAKNTPNHQRSQHQLRLLERVDFYNSLTESNSVKFGYVSRPWPIPGEQKTKRKGTFKKAGNLNFTHKLCDILKSCKAAEHKSINNAFREMLGEHVDKAYASGTLFIGNFIILLDKDSVVAEGAIHEVIPDFYADDSLSFAQFCNTAVNPSETHFSQVTAYYFEQEYTMKYPMEAVNGSVSFVGHNAILRTSHLKLNGYWNEEFVSEDLNLSMELTAIGYHGKLIDIPSMRFGEYVPVTLNEETHRYSRYSFGAAQIMFHPIIDWFSKGPIRQTFLNYLGASHLPWYVKLDVLTHLIGFVGMSLLVPMLLISAFHPNIVMEIHLTSVIFFFFASLLKVIPSAFICLDKVGKDKGVISSILRYLVFTIPKVFVDLSVSFVVGKGFFCYLMGKKPDHAPTSVDQFSAISVAVGYTLVKHSLKSLYSFLFLFVIALAFAHVSQVQPFSPFTYSSLVVLLLILSPFLLTPEFNVFFLRKLRSQH